MSRISPQGWEPFLLTLWRIQMSICNRLLPHLEGLTGVPRCPRCLHPQGGCCCSKKPLQMSYSQLQTAPPAFTTLAGGTAAMIQSTASQNSGFTHRDDLTGSTEHSAGYSSEHGMDPLGTTCFPYSTPSYDSSVVPHPPSRRA